MGAAAKVATSAGEHSPTKKRIVLLEYLCRLLLPPPLDNGHRRLLDLFSDTSPALIGGRFAGWDEVEGVEMIGDYCDIGETRQAW